MTSFHWWANNVNVIFINVSDTVIIEERLITFVVEVDIKPTCENEIGIVGYNNTRG